MERKKVLVIDDEQIVLDSVSKILSGEYDVDVCLRGREGLEMAQEHHYDLVLTDVRMPDMGGMVVLREIKRADPQLPVVIITGFATVRSAVQAMKLGASDYLEKPFSPEELHRVVASGLSGKKAGEVEDHALVHREEMLKVLDRAASDRDFIDELLHHWADALDGYDLTSGEKLALLTGDVEGIENCTGPLTPNQRSWLEQPLSAELLRTFGW